jgi:hypothetical protein
MNKNLLLVAMATLITSVSFSQTNKNSRAPQKGYYAIGNNASKYPQGTLVVTNSGGFVNKGFYAQNKFKQKADSNATNAKNNTQVFAISNKPVPQSKGFYSQSKYQQARLADVAKDKARSSTDSTTNP